MYGGEGSLNSNRENTNDSEIKKKIDSWFAENLDAEITKDNIGNKYSTYLSRTAVYCNDRATDKYVQNDSNVTQIYMMTGAAIRLNTNKRPSYRCGVNPTSGELYTGSTIVVDGEPGAADIADRFTVSNRSNVGNQKLTYPIALMTADEVAYAGGLLFKNNIDVYYYKNSNGESITNEKLWWTMSPYGLSWNPNPGYPGLFAVRGEQKSYPYYKGDLDASFPSSGEFSVRPVLSLKSCVSWKSGDGTVGSPYEVEIDDACAAADN